MSIRLVCPSCSAALSVKDEYAGRAVKCPKCGGVIPASQPGASAPTPSKPSVPALPPPPPPFEMVDDPEPPKRPAGRVTGKVAARGDDRDAGDADEPVAKRKSRDADGADDEPVAKRAKRRGDDADADRDDDRPARRKRRGYDDDGGRPGKKEGGSSAVMIIAIICGTLLLCCGGTSAGVYFYIIKPVKEGVENAVDKAREDFKAWNFQVSKFNYDELEVGDSTRTVADTKLGSGKVATDEDLKKVFANDPGRISDWNAKVTARRAVVWQHGEDYVLAAFHPSADGTGRLQVKEWLPKSGAALKEGEQDDAKFLQQYPVGGGPGLPVTAVELATAYKAGNGTIGDPTYKNKVLLIEGKIKEIELNFSTPREFRVVFEGVKKDGGGTIEPGVVIAKTDVKKILGLSVGQTVKLKCKCKGFSFGSLDLENGTLSSFDPDMGTVTTATALIAEYVKDNEATDEKYSTKFLTVTDAVVDSVNGNTLVVRGPGKGSATKIQVTLKGDEFTKAAGTIRVNQRIKLKGTYSQFGGDKSVNLSYAWVVPD